MPRGRNNNKTRKMRRKLERQQKKGKVDDAEVQQFEKSVEDKNKFIEQKKNQQQAEKDYEATKESINKEINKVKNITIDIDPVKTTSYVIMAYAVQVMLVSAAIYFSNTMFGSVLGFLSVFINIVTCLLMKSHPYKKSEHVIKDSKIDEKVSTSKSFNFTKIGSTVITLDRIVSGLVTAGTGYLMISEQGIYRSIIFISMSLYRDYVVGEKCYVDKGKQNYYFKDLTSTIVMIIYYLILATGLPRFLFFIAMTLCYRDAKEIMSERMKSLVQQPVPEAVTSNSGTGLKEE